MKMRRSLFHAYAVTGTHEIWIGLAHGASPKLHPNARARRQDQPHNAEALASYRESRKARIWFLCASESALYVLVTPAA